MACRLGLPHGSSLHRCMLVLTFLLLLCEIVVSRLCDSLITMVDVFHTLFILMHMALPLAQPTLGRGPPKPPPASPLSTSTSITSTPTQSPVKSPPYALTISCVSPIPSSSASCPSPPLSTPVLTTTSQFPSKPLTPTTTHCFSPDHSESNQLTSYPHPTLSVPANPFPRRLPPQASLCGLSYSEARVQPLGALISALLLAALCVSVSLDILSHTLQPHPIQHPLLATVMGVVSLLYNLLVLGLSWGSWLGTKTRAAWEGEERSVLGVNGKVKAEVQTKDSTGVGGENDLSNLTTSLHGAFQDGTLVLCNPGTSSVLNPDSDSQHPPQTSLLRTVAPQGPLSDHCHGAHTPPADSHTLPADCRTAETPNNFPNQEASGCHPKYPNSEMSKCVGHRDNQTGPTTVSALKSESPTRLRVQLPTFLPSIITLTQALLGSILALTNGLTLLLLGPDCLHGSGACGPFIYLDPGFSMVAVVVLLATALPQVCRYGWLLLQASPSQVCVSDLGRQIASVPGVQAVHDLHVWQLTESYLVASVHVHCHAGFQIHRCGDLMSGVTKVLQSVGVSCCTVQPEFLLSTPSANGNMDNNNTNRTIIHREIHPLPSHLACSLACGKGCVGRMCCAPLEEGSTEPLAPPAGETEEPHVLIIENAFL
ncbi:probable zinc transporter protein DDB_G0282067 [Oncorhynchus tshawytscha]|uniref:Cation efflux protein cytoplasmic domain-containing protein n=1 Tax=Oncorhynchus tshawytscha TaxID=74940 RepID=A0A8C8GIL5_ONCTS|nr:probable zinc transporter protein DDB_G0282067 [Oncorhynchus tshawytscha]